MSKDKKQILVVGILGLAMLGIGAFQFLAPKGPAAAAPKPKDTAVKSDETLVAVGDLDPLDDSRTGIIGELLGPVEPRDPFLAQAIIIDPDDKPPKPPKPPTPRPRTEFQDGGPNGPYRPVIGGGGVQSGTELRQPYEFSYKLKGVLVGARQNIAVFESDSGNQELVGEGDTFGSEDETAVISIDAKGVTIRHRGKTKILRVEQG